MMKAFRVIAQSYSEQELARLISTGQIERVIETAFSDNVLNAAYAPVRDRIRSGVTDGVRYFVKQDIPVPKSGTIGIAFDSLSPYVVEAIKKLETKVITNLKDNVRETVRQHIERGLTEGLSPKQMSKGLREIIGLSPNQELAVSNYEKALRGEGRNPLDYKLRDKRFDKTLAKGKPLTEEQIQRQVGAYRTRLVNHNALTNARTAALDTQKLAQKLSWQSAIDQGIVDGDRLQKTWIGVMDSRERPEHVAMEGETVPWNVPFSNGEDVPGSSTYNCRCVSRYTQRRA
jgi:uncharacterized protein with gpF-like domain